jgi:2-polyprenyl-3-methyl-5-hydroxy-6-metoxy-1,4-benzoquinol methylase
MTTPNFQRRSSQKELMDVDMISFEEFHACLKDLAKVNVWTLAHPPTLHWLTDKMRHQRFPEPVSVLDVGSGGGDMLRRVGRWAKNHHFQIVLMGIDINPWSKKSAESITERNVDIEYITEDIFSLDAERQFDFIISSLFTHHLDNTQLIQFIAWMDRHARHGWFINDLHRHAIPYYFIKYCVRFLSSNRLIIHDAPLSVNRAFTRQDWQLLLNQAGISGARVDITWHFPFRYCISCTKQ